MKIISPTTLAAAARDALNKAGESPRDHFNRLVQRGFINASGQVTTVLGGVANPEKDSACCKGQK